MQRRVAVDVCNATAALERFALDEFLGKGNGLELSCQVKQRRAHIVADARTNIHPVSDLAEKHGRVSTRRSLAEFDWTVARHSYGGTRPVSVFFCDGTLTDAERGTEAGNDEQDVKGRHFEKLSKTDRLVETTSLYNKDNAAEWCWGLHHLSGPEDRIEAKIAALRRISCYRGDLP